jgi:DNA-binding GntR family transcriptional regulator
MTPTDGDRAPIRRSTLTDEIANRIRRQIMTGTIQPGDRIFARDLVGDFGVSHIPIREALRRLEAEGLVHSTPSRGIVAANVGLEELSEIWDLRRIVEGHVIRRAARKMGEEQLAEIDKAMAHLRKAIEEPHSTTFLHAHTDLHWALLSAGATGWIHRILNQLWQGSDRYIHLFSTAIPLNRRVFLAQHMTLVHACHTGDPNKLANALIEHINLTEDDVRRGYLASRGAVEPADQVASQVRLSAGASQKKH